jgi:hypothetical protein
MKYLTKNEAAQAAQFTRYSSATHAVVSPVEGVMSVGSLDHAKGFIDALEFTGFEGVDEAEIKRIKR